MDNEAPENEVKERTDIELLRELLERKKQLLSKCLGTPGIDKSDEHIRMQKLEVGALASMLCELEDLEEKKDRPKQPELPPLTQLEHPSIVNKELSERLQAGTDQSNARCSCFSSRFPAGED